MNLTQIKQQFQLVEDNLGIAINNLSDYQRAINKDLAGNLLTSMAIWYENNPPTQDEIFNLDINVEDVQAHPALQRIIQSFIAAGKILNINCIGGQL